MTVKKIFKKKAFWIPTCIFLGLVLVVALCLLSNSPYRRGADYIKSWIKEQLPVGTEKEEVLAWLAEESGLDNYTEIDRGYYSLYDYTLPEVAPEKAEFIGVTSIQSSYSYSNPWTTDVDIYFGFDENDRLIDVGVRVDSDTL